MKRTVATLLAGLMVLSVLGPLASMPVAAASTEDAWNNSTDWDSLQDESGVVHESVGDRSASSVQIGNPSDDTDLVSYYTMDEDSGTLTDTQGLASGSTAGVSYDENGVYSTSALGVSSTDKSEINITDVNEHNFGNSSFTVSIWIKTTNTTGKTTIIEKRDPGGTWNGWSLWKNEEEQGGLVFDVVGTDSAKLTWDTDAYADGNYHLLTAVYDDPNDETRLYMDGELKNTTSATPGDFGVREKTTIGYRTGPDYPNEKAQYFDGNVDEVQFYNKVMNQQEIENLSDTTGDITTQPKSTSLLQKDQVVLGDVDAQLNGGTTNVVVESDPDSDGTYEETSNSISLNDSATEYHVSGFSQASNSFRVSADMSGTVSEVPVLSGVGVAKEPVSGIHVGVKYRVNSNSPIDRFNAIGEQKEISDNFSIETSQESNLTVHAFETSNQTVTNFTVDQPSGTMEVTIGGLVAGEDYQIQQDGENYTTLTANSTGEIAVTKDSNWSEHTFKVTALSGTSDDDPDTTLLPTDDPRFEIFGVVLNPLFVVLGTVAAVVVGLVAIRIRRE
ncbi:MULTISPECIES: LamG domain-containing protein [Haloarcula]|uniref:LamG domain-containing protein n=1 Tax=Haloarcula TaxID=2237 RepID=UPI0023E83C4B|nr:LamG domain-containing protein [Halomicroarcula sp. SHR3]